MSLPAPGRAFVYAIHDVDGRTIYIGQTSLPLKIRWSAHLSAARRPNPKQRIARYLHDHEASIHLIEETFDSYNCECFWIAWHIQRGCNLLNQYSRHHVVDEKAAILAVA